jgi:hypothetical protein
VLAHYGASRIRHIPIERTFEKRVKMKRFVIAVGIVIAILVGLALLTEDAVIAPFLYRVF